MKNLFFSLLVVGAAFAASAFTNNNNILNPRYVQDPVSGDYIKITSTYDPNECADSSTDPCSFEQVSNLSHPYGTILLKEDLENEPLVFIPSEENGVYNGTIAE